MDSGKKYASKGISLMFSLILLGGLSFITDSLLYRQPRLERKIISTRMINTPEGRLFTSLHKEGDYLVLNYPPYTLFKNNEESQVDIILYSSDYNGKNLTPEQADSLWDLATN